MMRASMLVGIALGAVAGAVLTSSSTQVSDAVTKSKSDFNQKWKKLKSVLK